MSGAVAPSLACSLRKQWSRDRSSRLAHSFVEFVFPLSLIQEEQVCQLLAKKLASSVIWMDLKLRSRVRKILVVSGTLTRKTHLTMVAYLIDR